MSAIHGVNYGAPTLDLNFAKNKSLIDTVTGRNLITFTRSQTAREATYVGADGLIKTAAANEPRFDHNPTTGESLGLLVEEARTNIIVSSSVFNTGSWTEDGVVLTANAGVAPDGTTTATSVSQGTGSNRCYHFDNNGAGSKTLTVFAKSNAGSSITLSGNLSYGTNSIGSAVLNTANGAISTALGCSSVAFPNGWYRFIIPIFVGAGSGNSNYLSITGPASSVFLWGVQIEAGSFPTSYIPTTSATVTRAADVASITGTNFSSWYRQDEGTVFCQGISNSVSNSAYWTLQGTSSNGASVLVYPANNLTYQVVNSSFQVNSSFASYPAVASVKTAAAIKLNNFAVVANGGTITSDTSGTVPAATSFVIGNYLGGGTSYDYSGTIARLTFYPVRLPDATLQSLTQ